MARIEGGNVMICDVSVEGGVKKVVEGVRRFGLRSKDILRAGKGEVWGIGGEYMREGDLIGNKGE